MKGIFISVILFVAAIMPAMARDNVVLIALDLVLEMPEAKAKLDGSVKFYLAGTAAPKVVKNLGEGIANRKTNSVGKDPEQACKWAALSALIALQEGAQAKGANAVIDLISFYKREPFSDPKLIQCHDGAIVTGVAFKGTYATVGH
jgi:uncharacterized protein YbjQ (UPF0145 family)